MPTSNSTIRGRSALFFVPATLTGSTITGWGTVVKINTVTELKPKYAKSAEASKSEVIQITYNNGVVGEASKIAKTVNLSDGTEKTSGSGGGDADMITCIAAESEKWFVDNIVPLRGKPGVFVIPSGENITATNQGWFYLLGTVSNDIELGTKGEEVVTSTIEITGKAYDIDSSSETAIQAMAWGTITPVGEASAIGPEALVSGDMSALQAGTLIFTEES